MIFALVDSTVGPCLQTEAVLFIIAPRTHILGTVGMRVGTVTICFVIDPLSFVNVTICVVQLSDPIRFSIFPLALVATSIEPFLLALPITDPVKPLALVDCATVEVHGSTELSNVFFEVSGLGVGGIVTHAKLGLVVVSIGGGLVHVGGLRKDLFTTSLHHLPASFVHHLVFAHGLLHPVRVDSLDSILCSIALSVTIGEKTGTVSHFFLF